MRGTMAIAVLGGGVLFAAGPPLAVGAEHDKAPASVVIGVDHLDPANQNPPGGRLFEYTDFFSRELTVAQGETVDFRTAPGFFHIVALATSEKAARAAYPPVSADTSDPKAPNGGPHLALGASFSPILNGSTTVPFGPGVQVAFDRPNGPPLCGVPYAVGPIAATAPCSFTGGTDVEVAGPSLRQDAMGNPLAADWNVTINATPGRYTYFCYIHPGMSGTLKVVARHGDDSEVTSQSEINKDSAEQFAEEQASAVKAEKQANVVTWTGGAPGTRTYTFKVGISAADDHVAIDEMLPNIQTVAGGPPHLTGGDRVKYVWADDHNIHSVLFPARPDIGFSNDIGPIGNDCGEGYVAFGPPAPCTGAEAAEHEVIFDPGTAASGTVLHTRSDLADSGLLVGSDYKVPGSVQKWSVKLASNAATGRYLFHCTLHDFMVSGFTV